MLQMIEANWLAFTLALLIGLVVAWWLFARGSTDAKPRERKPDALDEGAAPAARNQALIDAPPAADLTPTPGDGALAAIDEPVAVAARDDAEEAPVRETQARAEPPPPGDVDDLGKIKGVGPKLVALLQSLGITSYAQIAGMSDADLDELDSKLGSFAGRPRRDSWAEQAKLLAGDDRSAYEAKFGKL